MNTILKNITYLINKSNISILGSLYSSEYTLDYILSLVDNIIKLPEEYYNINYDNIISFVNSNSDKIIYIDMSLLYFDKKNNNVISKSNHISKFTRFLRELSSDKDVKFILINHIYESMMSGSYGEYSFSGGRTILFIADFVCMITNNEIKILKNRYNDFEGSYLINEIIRDDKLEKILDDEISFSDFKIKELYETEDN